MTDEPNGHTADDDNRLPKAWAMPQPVFRSTDGITPKNRQKDAADASTDPDSLAAAEPATDPTVESTEDQAAEKADRIKVIAAPQKPKRGGCAFSVMAILMIIVSGLAALIIVLAYLYYSTPVPDPFNN